MERQIYILYYIRKLKFYYYKYNFSHILKSQGFSSINHKYKSSYTRFKYRKREEKQQDK